MALENVTGNFWADKGSSVDIRIGYGGRPVITRNRYRGFDAGHIGLECFTGLMHGLLMTEPSLTKPRQLDHLVLPVSSLDHARARYETLGFTVAPDGIHPFGTENCCIYLDDATMLEPLAIGHRETCEAAVLDDNTFVRNDQTYRFRRGDEGFSHLVIKSDDAAADDAMYRKYAMSGGPVVDFSRAFETPDGKADEMSVRLAYAGDPRAPDAGFFACETRNVPKVDQTALKTHDNGAVGLLEVVMSEPNPTDFQYFLQSFLNQREVDSDSFGMSLDTQQGTVTVLTPDGMEALFDMQVERYERGLRLQGYVIAVLDLKKTAALLERNGVATTRKAGRVIVAPAEGQGCFVAFAERSQ